MYLWTGRAVEKWITAARPALPGRGSLGVHMRTELSTVQPVSSVIPATAWPLTFCLSGRTYPELARIMRACAPSPAAVVAVGRQSGAIYRHPLDINKGADSTLDCEPISHA